MHSGFKNVPHWENYASANLSCWHAYNPGKDLYKEDAIVKAINQRAKEVGRGLNAREISEIQSNFY